MEVDSQLNHDQDPRSKVLYQSRVSKKKNKKIRTINQPTPVPKKTPKQEAKEKPNQQHHNKHQNRNPHKAKWPTNFKTKHQPQLPTQIQQHTHHVNIPFYPHPNRKPWKPKKLVAQKNQPPNTHQTTPTKTNTLKANNIYEHEKHDNTEIKLTLNKSSQKRLIQ